MKKRLEKDQEKEIFYYARNHIMSKNKVFDSKFKALSYIESVGTVETYKLKGNYYYFIVSIDVGRNKCSGRREGLPKFGEVLPGGRIHKNNAKWLLGL